MWSQIRILLYIKMIKPSFPNFLHSNSLLQIVYKYKCTQFIGSALKIKTLLDSTRKHIICSRNQEVTSYVRDENLDTWITVIKSVGFTRKKIN